MLQLAREYCGSDKAVGNSQHKSHHKRGRKGISVFKYMNGESQASSERRGIIVKHEHSGYNLGY